MLVVMSFVDNYFWCIINSKLLLNIVVFISYWLVIGLD